MDENVVKSLEPELDGADDSDSSGAEATASSESRDWGSAGEEDSEFLGSELSDVEEESELSDAEEESDLSDVERMRAQEEFVRTAEETDTSDEEELRNTVGNIPLEWYDHLAHLGYDIEGVKVPKPLSAGGDELDEFLAKMDNPDYWRTIHDKATGEERVLTDEQIDIIQHLQGSSYPDPMGDPYEPYTDHFTGDKQVLPLPLAPKPKSSFIPSKWEHRKIVKLAHAMRMGWIKPHSPVRPKPSFYELWGSGQENKGKGRAHIPAPRMELPGHAESYNPPPEYLPTEKQREEWLAEDEQDRATNYLPQKYKSLREVPAYSSFIKERFERCLDLYLCPRQRKMRVQVNPEDLIPQLPKLSDLQPFPSVEAVVYEGHSGVVQCVCVEDKGQWLASVASDCTLKLWEVATGWCMDTITFPTQPTSLAFCPNARLALLAVAVGKQLLLVNAQVGDRVLVKSTRVFLEELPVNVGESAFGQAGGIDWSRDDDRIILEHPKHVKQVCWHGRGDYFATVTAEATGGSDCSVYIHQLSKVRSQRPFRKLKGRVQKVTFHPFKPLFFLATQTCVRVYDLVRQELVKRLMSGVKWISSMAVHPSGDHLIVTSYDKKLCWFDLQLSSKPYKVLRQHKQAIRSAAFHSCFPLFASSSDDGSVIVCHGKIFNDLLQNPLIVPVKLLKASRVVQGLGAVEVVFHPTLPWLFTAGADSTIRLYSN